jgi:ZIP family zinc transporter
MGVAEGEVGKAFGMVCAAGLATSIGAGVVFSDRLIALANKKALAGCLGTAAGVMLYVSFLDIFAKSHDAYSEVHSPSKAYAYTTITFFSGFALYWLISVIVHMINPDGHSHDADFLEQPKKNDDKPLPANSVEGALEAGKGDAHGAGKGDAHGAASGEYAEQEQKKLANMGLMTALAISIHNFPEGLLCFVGYIADPAVGVSLAVAIGIHNIPEGLCVAIPVYYSTGSRCKAFAWGMLSGVSEILGGFLGWMVLANAVSPDTYGALFGIVGGMMVMICISELIPTAHRYDPHDEVTTKSIIFGMAVMALSLILLNL